MLFISFLFFSTTSKQSLYIYVSRYKHRCKSMPGLNFVMVKLVIGVLFLRLVFQLVVSAVDVERLNIWPMPQSVSYGHQVLYMSKDFELRTEGSKYPDASGILKDGFSRLLYVINAPEVADGNISHIQQSLVLQGINVLISSPNDELQYGIDESYKLSVTSSGDPVNAHLGLQYGIDESYKSSVVSSGDPVYAHLEAKTVYGALHGLQTFSQLCLFNFSTRLLEVRQAPWDIRDQPRFSYRGLLIDTARHYQPLEMIKKVIDSMAYAKLNVLHWHIVDSQSFPLEIPSFSKLWNGAFSITERYTMAEAAEVVSYAQRRGINVLAEIDVPGHAQSWGTGYPTLWPSHDCQQPLDVSNEFTFQVIDGILSDFSKVFKFKFVHLGGDEVNTSCWVTTPRVKNWLEKHGMNESEAYEYFVLRAQKIALSHGYECVNWEETFNNFGDKLNRKTVVHNWLGGGVAQQVVASGLRCIVSNQDKWYLDHLDTTWSEFYSNEPLAKITDPKQQALVMGGEVCMWGERVDSSDIEQTIWPRAAAAAERLWTPYDKLAKDPRQVTSRLAHFRCLLNQRGVAAAPLAAPGRGAPLEPGSCYAQ